MDEMKNQEVKKALNEMAKTYKKAFDTLRKAGM
jgi:translation elongation factor EF-Ts